MARTHTTNGKTKKKRLAEEIAKAVGAGRPVAVPTVDFNDSNCPNTCLEVDFPIIPINQISQIGGFGAVSAGIGATPVLAMLYALADTRSKRHIFWIQAARDRNHHPFVNEVHRLMLELPRARSYVCYSKPGARDRMGEDFDAAGHLSPSLFEEIGVPRDSDVYLCGPTRFMTDMKEALASSGVPPERIHVELFNGSESMTPGVVGVATRTPDLPEDDANTGPLVSFARSGIAAHIWYSLESWTRGESCSTA